MIANKRPKVDTAELSKYTGLSQPTHRRQRNLGIGPRYYKVGSRVLYDLDDVDQWLAQHRVEPKAAA